MSALLATLGFVVAAWISFTALASLIVSIAWQVLAPRLHAAHPRQRASFALASAVAPAVIPVLLLVACLVPSLAGLVDARGDHCLAHADHPHLCLLHAVGALEAPGAVLLVLTLGALVLGLTRAWQRVRRAQLLLTGLRQRAPRTPHGHVVRVRSSLPFCFVAGLLRPEIFLSSRLIDALESGQLEIVLAHERAHQARRDPLRRAIAEACSLALPAAVRRSILGELALASEQACDEEAACRAGDRLAVAETLVAVERLAQPATGSAMALLPAFGASDIPARVHSLLDEPPVDRRPGWIRKLAAAILLLALFVGADPIHHLTEHWLRLFF